MNGKHLRFLGFMSAVWANLQCWCWCWKWISYQGFLLITHTILRRKARKRFKSCFSFNWELRKHENVWFYISCPTTSQVRQSAQRRNAEWMLDCWVSDKNSGIVKTAVHCRAPLGSVFCIKSYQSFHLIQHSNTAGAGRDRSARLGWEWFLFLDFLIMI